MASRFHDAGQTIYDFGKTFLVVCPRCQRRASVVPLLGTEPKLFAPRRLVCARCGYSKDWRGDTQNTSTFLKDISQPNCASVFPIATGALPVGCPAG